MRKRIFQIIEVAEDNDILSKIYDVLMMVVIILSLIPIALKRTGGVIGIIDAATTVIFIVDYIMRLITADFKLEKGRKSFALYPFMPMAIIDLISILPALVAINSVIKNTPSI